MVAVRHERLGQLTQVRLDGARDRLVLPLDAVLEAQLLHFPPVEPHREQLAHLRRDAHQPVQALVLEPCDARLTNARNALPSLLTSALELFDARADEEEADVVEARLLVLGRLAGLGVRLTSGETRERAMSILKVGHSGRALRESLFTGCTGILGL